MDSWWLGLAESHSSVMREVGSPVGLRVRVGSALKIAALAAPTHTLSLTLPLESDRLLARKGLRSQITLHVVDHLDQNSMKTAASCDK